MTIPFFSTIMGVRCKDGIILGTEKIVPNKMMISGTDRRIASVTPELGSVCNGIIPDGRALVQKARDEIDQYQKMYMIKMPIGTISERISMQF